MNDKVNFGSKKVSRDEKPKLVSKIFSSVSFEFSIGEFFFISSVDSAIGFFLNGLKKAKLLAFVKHKINRTVNTIEIIFLITKTYSFQYKK